MLAPFSNAAGTEKMFWLYDFGISLALNHICPTSIR